LEAFLEITFNLKKLIREQREALGWTQSELARAASVSLPTIQKFEAGRGNPSFSVLCSVLGVLGLELVPTLKPFQGWDELAWHGLPMMSQSKQPEAFFPNANQLVELTQMAAQEVSQRDVSLRKKEALQALLLALAHHYPLFYKKNFSENRNVKKVFPEELSGRLIKLRRGALQKVSYYL
jgi:transcriptional regulator with XRE-family HTH domain